MSELSNKTLQYFTAPKDYFWRWSEKAEIIEWHDGVTIAYRDELTALLKDVAVQCEPKRLGAVLLVLAACREDLLGSVRGAIFYEIFKKFSEGNYSQHSTFYEDLENTIGEVFNFLSRINALNADLRKEKGKILLIKQLFEDESDTFKPHSLSAFVDELASGRLDSALTRQPNLTLAYFKADMLPLYNLSLRYPDVESLETKILTGLDTLPKPIDIKKPEENDPLSILEELAADTKTAGLAQLTQSLIAALNVPMHAQGASDLPLGGVADITNRGNFDKLLLSELAQEDDLLTARLVNNEALYLRREMPPAQPDRERVILLDTTLKMWGLPRPFALSAALALSENNKNSVETTVFALNGMTWGPLSISTKKGVLDALNYLSPALHCGVALDNFLKKAAKTAATDYIFISDADAMAHPTFKELFAQIKPYLRFLVVVNRLGDLQFFDYQKGQTKLINTSKFDLDELLFSIKKPLKKSIFDKKLPELEGDEMPYFLYYDQTPLFFPPVNIQLDKQNNLNVLNVGVLVITKSQRVLFFKTRDKGAVELSSFIEVGDYKIAHDPMSKLFYILVYKKHGSLLKLYEIERDTLLVRATDFSQYVNDVEEVEDVQFEHQKCTVFCGKKSFEILLTVGEPKIRESSKKEKISAISMAPDLNYTKRFINRGFNVLQRLKCLYINGKGCLSFENYYLDVDIYGQINLLENSKLSKITKNYDEKRLFMDNFEVKAMPDNQQIKFYKVTWLDGSVAMLDSRGFLHLKSSNPDIPELTIVLLAGKQCAAWAADGSYSGNPYFIPQTEKMLSGSAFYARYIQAFLSELQNEEAQRLPF